MAEAANGFGDYLRSQLTKKGLSMRRLAELCGVDPATVSRLIAGKQRIRPEHVAMLAKSLDVPAIELWQAAGFSIAERVPDEASQYGADDPFALPVIAGLDVSRIRAELQKCRDYAGTPEGQEIIVRDFQHKIDQVQGIGPFIDELKAMFDFYMDETRDREQRSLLGSALLYFILATDIIPDYSFPIGYVDDAIAIDMVWREVQCWRRLT
ncbi:MAG: helix-turn-helix domain-containing protein [Bacilli bacterium]